MSVLPEFQIKKSYIVKNKINYDVSFNGNFIYEPYGILFTDYDLARKTQIFDSSKYSGITLYDWPFDYTKFVMNQYDNSYTILIGSEVSTEEEYSIGDITNTYEYTSYYVTSNSGFTVGDYVEVSMYTKQTVTGTAVWTHDGAVGETWFVDGYTDNYTYWSATGITTSSGETSGTVNWSVNENNPIFKYKAFVNSIQTSPQPEIRLQRKIENYLINNVTKTNETYQVYYKIRNLNTCNSSYEDLAVAISESIFGGYLDYEYAYDNLTATGMTIITKKNDEHLYFNYDDMTFNVYVGSSVTNYKFTTYYLYNKYTLLRMLEQYGYSGTDDINLTYTSNVTASAYTGTEYYQVTLGNDSDVEYFTPYTYVRLYTSSGNYKCLLTDISGTTCTLITSPLMTAGETATQLRNITDISTISSMLNECYINIEGG